MVAMPNTNNVATAVANPASVSEVAPASMKGTLMSVVDERTGNEYKVEVSSEGTIKALDFKKIYIGYPIEDLILLRSGHLTIVQKISNGVPSLNDQMLGGGDLYGIISYLARYDLIPTSVALIAYGFYSSGLGLRGRQKLLYCLLLDPGFFSDLGD
ncbi:hypothetical protein PIB30_082258 [Stylosanthes scabra]|uniref:Uncharacterized protein n=1 Tax=Stylosanthes scabra TaxID=79078 RepID=A0ABU6XSY6_9FABA|nr:hypothetical protein [Stylosanthes scabra]